MDKTTLRYAVRRRVVIATLLAVLLCVCGIALSNAANPIYVVCGKVAIAAVLAAVLCVCGIALGNAANPVGTARLALHSCVIWSDIWPFPRGGNAPFRLINLFYALGIFKPVRVKVWPGFYMELDSRDFVTRNILTDGAWEARINGIAIAFLQEGSVFVDVGAHVGYHSLFASTQVGLSGRVVAIEPNPPTAERLRRNIRLNRCTNIVVEEAACTEKEQQLELIQGPVHNTGNSSLTTKNAFGANRVAVRGVPLDALIKTQNLQRIDLVKIDVEGAELQVLHGMKETVAKYHPRIIIELRTSLLAGMGTSMDEVATWFRQAGYLQGHQIDDDDFLWCPDPAWNSPKSFDGEHSTAPELI